MPVPLAQGPRLQDGGHSVISSVPARADAPLRISAAAYLRDCVETVIRSISLTDRYYVVTLRSWTCRHTAAVSPSSRRALSYLGGVVPGMTTALSERPTLRPCSQCPARSPR